MTKVWFVTGSSRGLGREIVTTALKAGDRVFATARDTASLKDLVVEHADHIQTYPLDVRSWDAAQEAVSKALESFGRIDVLVNNAGYGDLASVEDVQMDAFQAQIDTNFYGVVNLSKAVVATMREHHAGHILQVSSIGGRTAAVGLSAYQSAKWAVGGFSSVLAQELAPFGVKVTVLEPGGMRTDWAGSSMTIPPVSEPYEQTVGAFANMLREHSSAESTDPVKVANVIYDIAGRDDAPLRLLLGKDAVSLANSYAADLAANDATWRPISESVSDSDGMDITNIKHLVS